MPDLPLLTEGAALKGHGAVQEMNSELKRQEKVLDAVTDHTDRSAYELQNVSQQAKKDFKVRPGEPFSAINATLAMSACLSIEHQPSKWHAQRQEALCRSSDLVCLGVTPLAQSSPLHGAMA